MFTGTPEQFPMLYQQPRELDMGCMKNAQIEIRNWLNSERNYEDGVFLYDRYGRNQQLKRLFPGRKERYAEKLAYELGKLIGITFNSGEPAPAADPVKQPAEEKGNGEKNNLKEDFVKAQAEKAEAEADRAEENAGFAEEQAERAEEQAERAEEFAGKTQDIIETLGAVAENSPVPAGNYPAVINRVIAEYARLYNERAMLKKQENEIPDENTDENMARRKAVIGRISSLSARMEILYQAKKAYLENGIIPQEDKLFQEEAPLSPEKLPKDKLMQMRNNLRSQITRIKNQLEYQSSKKAKQPNPMPECPKRKELEQRIKDKEKELAEVEKILNDNPDALKPNPEEGT